MKQLLLILSLLTTICAHASEVYRVTDEHGNTTYTNIKPTTQGKNIEKVQISEPNISAEAEHLPSAPEHAPEAATEKDKDKQTGQNTQKRQLSPQQELPQ